MAKPDRGGSQPRVCDYEGSPYRQDFWEGANRSFEDAVDRRALSELLPERPGRLLEIGAGYGRLVDAYENADEVYLLDYARSMLEDAADRLPSQVRRVCADLYHLPFAPRTFDTVVQVRVLHHVEDVPRAFLEVARILRPGGSYVLEYANKRHAKALARWLTGGQSEDPFDMRPHEFVELNWNFHPAYVNAALRAAGLEPRERRSASHFRAEAVKEHVPPDVLARADSLLGRALAPLTPGPSQYLRAARLTGGLPTTAVWQCPVCGGSPLVEQANGLDCGRCGRLWPLEDGVYLLREPFSLGPPRESPAGDRSEAV